MPRPVEQGQNGGHVQTNSYGHPSEKSDGSNSMLLAAIGSFKPQLIALLRQKHDMTACPLARPAALMESPW